MSRSWLRLPHTIDIMTKSTVSTSSGQRLASWTKSGESKCSFVPNRTNIRVAPTVEEKDLDMIFFPHDANITYDTRLENLRDRQGNVIYAGPLQIVAIKKPVGYQGRVNHLQVRVESVIE